MIGITENEEALRQWMVAGPEVTELLNVNNTKYCDKVTMSTKHHEQISCIQKKFLKDVKNLVISMEEVGNPLIEESNDLFTFDTKGIMSSDVIQDIKTTESKGLDQSIKFQEEIIVQKSKLFYDPISKNKFKLFKSGSRKQVQICQKRYSV